MFHFLRKYSPDYGKNNLEGWSVVLVSFAGFVASTFANSWLEMFGLLLAGILLQVQDRTAIFGGRYRPQ